MAVLFVVGAACFTVGGVVTQWSSVSRPAIGYVFFVGSIFFTTAAALQYAESLASGRRIDRLSSLVQLWLWLALVARARRGLSLCP